MLVNSTTKRIGLIVPSSNTVMEVDFYTHLPAHITVHIARMNLEVTTPEGEARMLDDFTLPAARDLATAHPHAVVFGCTSAGALRGNAFDDQLCQQISEITGVPTISVIRSVREMLQTHQVHSLVVITPYIDALNKCIQASLEADGLEILHMAGLGITHNFAIAEVSTSEIVRFANQALAQFQPDALFISCTNFPAMRALPELRRILPVPVFTSNQAVLEMAIQAVARS